MVPKWIRFLLLKKFDISLYIYWIHVEIRKTNQEIMKIQLFKQFPINKLELHSMGAGGWIQFEKIK